MAVGAVSAGQDINAILNGMSLIFRGGREVCMMLARIYNAVITKNAKNLFLNGGEIDLNELQKLMQRLFNGQDTIKTIELPSEAFDKFKKLADQNKLLFCQMPSNDLTSKSFIIGYAGSNAGLVNHILNTLNIDLETLRTEEAGRADIFDKEVVENAEDFGSIPLGDDGCISMSAFSNDLNKFDKAHEVEPMAGRIERDELKSDIVVRKHYPMKSDGDLVGKDVGNWKNELNNAGTKTSKSMFHKNSVKKDEIMDTLRKNPTSFRYMSTQDMSFEHIKYAVQRDPMNLCFIGKNEHRIIKDHDRATNQSTKDKVEHVSYFELVKHGLKEKPEIYPWLVGSGLKSVHSSLSLARIAILGELNKPCCIKNLEYTKIKGTELIDLCKDIVNKDPTLSVMALRKAPCNAVRDEIIKQFADDSKDDKVLLKELNKKREAFGWAPLNMASFKALRDCIFKDCEAVIRSCAIRDQNVYGEPLKNLVLTKADSQGMAEIKDRFRKGEKAVDEKLKCIDLSDDDKETLRQQVLNDFIKTGKFDFLDDIGR